MCDWGCDACLPICIDGSEGISFVLGATLGVSFLVEKPIYMVGEFDTS